MAINFPRNESPLLHFSTSCTSEVFLLNKCKVCILKTEFKIKQEAQQRCDVFRRRWVRNGSKMKLKKTGIRWCGTFWATFFPKNSMTFEIYSCFEKKKSSNWLVFPKMILRVQEDSFSPKTLKNFFGRWAKKKYFFCFCSQNWFLGIERNICRELLFIMLFLPTLSKNFSSGWSKLGSTCPEEHFEVKLFLQSFHVNTELAKEGRKSLHIELIFLS